MCVFAFIEGQRMQVALYSLLPLLSLPLPLKEKQLVFFFFSSMKRSCVLWCFEKTGD